MCNGIPDGPESSPKNPGSDTTDEPPGRSPDCPQVSAQTFDFRAGDLVRIDRYRVNGRAWMSKIAPIQHTMVAGTQAIVIGEIGNSEGKTWIKIRDLERSVESYVATRYITPIESVSRTFDTLVSTPILPLPESASVWHSGDIFVASRDAYLRTGAGKAAEIIQRLPKHTIGTVIGDSQTVDGFDWIPVRIAENTGWVATRNTTLLTRGARWLEVDLSTQTTIAWMGSTPVCNSPVSTGKPGFRTPTGIFTILAKYPARQLKGIVRDASWNIPGVPWIMVFRTGGFYFHGVYWHDDFGQAVSHGCVTLSPSDAENLYLWTPVNTCVWIHDGARNPLRTMTDTPSSS